MGLYFYCPGQVQASGNTVTCSVPVESYTPDPGFMTADAINTFAPFVFYFFALIFGFCMIKKAIEM